MSDVLFTIGNIKIYGYGFLIAVGILVASIGAFICAHKKGLNLEVVLDLICCNLCGGLIGGKLLSVLVNVKYALENNLSFDDVFGGIVIYGAIIGAALACLIYCKVKNVSFLEYGDIALPCICFAHGIGRLGCLSAGCCYGKEYHGFGAITFTDSVFAPNNIPLIPTQIISSVFMIIFGCICLWIMFKKKTPTGYLSSTYFLVYGIARFVVEFLRGDVARGHILFLSTSQFISIFIIVLGIILRYKVTKKAPQ